MNLTNTIIVSVAVALIYTFIIKPKKDKKAAELKENPTPGKPSFKMDLTMYDGMDYSELKNVLEEKYGKFDHDDRTQTLLCRKALVAMIGGTLIAYDEVKKVSVYYEKKYISNVYGEYVCEEYIAADINGYYNEDEKHSTVYDFDDVEESSSIFVHYERDGIEKMVSVKISEYKVYWLKNLVYYIVNKAHIDTEAQLKKNQTITHDHLLQFRP